MAEFESPQSRSQQAYELIRQRIVTLALPPGDVLDEGKLKDDLNIGRTPIREALQRLSRENLVTIVPRRGMFVAEIGLADLQRIVEVRLELEAKAARLAAQRGQPHHWQAMQDALDKVSADETSYDRLIEADEKFHRLIYQAADNPFLEDTLLMYFTLSLRLWHFTLSRVGEMRSVVNEHRYILAVLRERDGDEAARLMAHHVLRFQEEIQRVMLNVDILNTSN